MGELIKRPENTEVATKIQKQQNIRAHLLMMLEAMQYSGSIKHMGNSELRKLVEEQKLVFLRKLQEKQDGLK